MNILNTYRLILPVLIVICTNNYIIGIRVHKTINLAKAQLAASAIAKQFTYNFVLSPYYCTNSIQDP